MRIARRELILGTAAMGLLAARREAAGQATDATLTWPNADGKANSDEWLRLHHSEIKKMRPRVLALNFVNELTEDEARKRLEAVIEAIREASRYQGYKNKDAPVFLDYQIANIVNLTDDEPLPADQRLEGNSSQYPRVPDWKQGNNFRYSELFTNDFAQQIKMGDPARPNEALDLTTLVARGLIHEVWILARQGQFGAPHECTEVKQVYDANLRKIAGKSVQAGSGASDEQTFIGRSLRILHINPDRGAGLTLERLGRALESMARSRAVPYFSAYFAEFAGNNLKTRLKLPFDDFTGRQPNTPLEFPSPGTLQYQHKNETFSVRNYVAMPGSVMFPPNARREFDVENTMTPVLSNIEHYRLHDGMDGKDKADPWTAAKTQVYRQVAPDGVGAWMVYWRQSMPGLNNKAVDDTGRPMKNWWPFLFY